MTIQEAIDHCKEVANECGDNDCGNNHKQLAKWLQELLFYRTVCGLHDADG